MRLLGVRAVIAQSFERIHRSNLVGMGVLPLEFPEGTNRRTLGLDGSELYDLVGLAGGIRPRAKVNLRVRHADGKLSEIALRLRVDTLREAAWCSTGGILPYVLGRLVERS